MVQKLQLNSYAKLNLHLAVSARRADGFHALVSLFHQFSLHDQLTLEIFPSSSPQVECEMEGVLKLKPESNIAYQAALLFLQQIHCDRGCRIFIKKRIPAQAGLGGGSSNAMAVLRGLNRLFSDPLDENQLLSLALKLGSDLPFFLKGGASLVEGRGEWLTPLSPALSYPILVVVPPILISTKEAFLRLDSENLLSCNLEMEKKRIQEEFVLAPEQWSFYNSFQTVLEKDYPLIAQYRQMLLKEGALFASLSGSGSALFGIFETEEKREAARRQFANSSVKIYSEKLIANSIFMV